MHQYSKNDSSNFKTSVINKVDSCSYLTLYRLSMFCRSYYSRDVSKADVPPRILSAHEDVRESEKSEEAGRNVAKARANERARVGNGS